MPLATLVTDSSSSPAPARPRARAPHTLCPTASSSATRRSGLASPCALPPLGPTARPHLVPHRQLVRHAPQRVGLARRVAQAAVHVQHKVVEVGARNLWGRRGGGMRGVLARRKLPPRAPAAASIPSPCPSTATPRVPLSVLTWNSRGQALTNMSISIVLPHPTPPNMYSPRARGAARPGCGARPEEDCSRVDSPSSLWLCVGGGAGACVWACLPHRSVRRRAQASFSAAPATPPCHRWTRLPVPSGCYRPTTQTQPAAPHNTPSHPPAALGLLHRDAVHKGEPARPRGAAVHAAQLGVERLRGWAIRRDAVVPS